MIKHDWRIAIRLRDDPNFGQILTYLLTPEEATDMIASMLDKPEIAAVWVKKAGLGTEPRIYTKPWLKKPFYAKLLTTLTREANS